MKTVFPIPAVVCTACVLFDVLVLFYSVQLF